MKICEIGKQYFHLANHTTTCYRWRNSLRSDGNKRMKNSKTWYETVIFSHFMFIFLTSMIWVAYWDPHPDLEYWEVTNRRQTAGLWPATNGFFSCFASHLELACNQKQTWYLIRTKQNYLMLLIPFIWFSSVTMRSNMQFQGENNFNISISCKWQDFQFVLTWHSI